MIKPEIGPLVSLVGSAGFSVLGLLIPVVMETIWYWDKKSDYNDDYYNNDCDAVDNIEEQENIAMGCFNIAVPSYSIGMTMMWAVVGGVSVMATNTRSGITTRTASKARALKRAVRHVKNVIIVVLAVFALIGGIVNSVQQIGANASDGSGQPKPSM